jgi:hypothetical protein
MAMSCAPSAVQAAPIVVAARVGAWRRVRNCRRYAPGLLAKAAKVAVAVAVVAPEPRVAMRQAVLRQVIVAQPVPAASRMGRVLAAKVAVLGAPTAALAANRVARVPATACPAVGLHKVAARKARAIKLTATSHTAIKRMATRRTATHRMAMLPTATRHTATRAPTPRVVHVRKARVAIVRKVPVGRRARAAIVRTVAVVPDHKVTVAPLADVRQAAVAVVVVVAIVRAIAEPRLDMIIRGS